MANTHEPAPERLPAASTGTNKGANKFPLTLHPCGQWVKKIHGKIHYFGKDKQEAFRQYLLHASNLHAGRGRTVAPETTLTIKELCNLYLDHQHTQLEGKQIGWQHCCDQQRYLTVFLRFVGPDTLVGDIRTLAVQEFRGRLIAGGLAPDTVNNRLRAVRAVYNWALDNEIISQTPNLRAVKLMRTKKNIQRQTFTADQVKALLAVAGTQMRAMIMLGINCGFGCTDCAELKWENLDLAKKVVHYPRGKTEVDRNLTLWPATVKAIDAVERRGELVFYTKYGNPWVRSNTEGTYPDRAVTKEFKKLLNKANIPVTKGTGFYSLRRTAATITAETGDAFAVQALLGHADLTMASIYVQRGKLQPQADQAAEHSRQWLSLDEEKDSGTGPSPGE